MYQKKADSHTEACLFPTDISKLTDSHTLFRCAHY